MAGYVLETLNEDLKSKYGVNFSSVWHEGLTLGQFFEHVQQAKTCPTLTANRTLRDHAAQLTPSLGPNMTIRVAIYIFPNMEVLDFAGPFEVFTTASRVHGLRNPDQPALFEVYTIAQSAGAVQARAGLRVLPDYTFASSPQPNLLLVTGGVVNAELESSEVINWIIHFSKLVSVTASVCTGAFILAKAGLLTGRSATTHWEDIEDLRVTFPDVHVVENKRWVDEGDVVSSAGIAAGIDMSLHLVARFAGEALAQATARQMDVPYARHA